MTLSQNCKSSVIPLFGQNTGHSSVPAKICEAVARGVGQGRLSGRRASASPLTVASTMEALRSVGRMLCIAVTLAALMLSSGAAHAGQESSATPRPNEFSVRPLAEFVTEASKRFKRALAVNGSSNTTMGFARSGSRSRWAMNTARASVLRSPALSVFLKLG